MEWVLIVYLYMNGLSGFSSSAVTVPGFSSQALCDREATRLMTTAHGIESATCVKVN